MSFASFGIQAIQVLQARGSRKEGRAFGNARHGEFSHPLMSLKKVRWIVFFETVREKEV